MITFIFEDDTGEIAAKTFEDGDEYDEVLKVTYNIPLVDFVLFITDRLTRDSLHYRLDKST